MIEVLADTRPVNPRIPEPAFQGRRFTRTHALYGTYALAFAVAISVWFIPIRAPLWLDETGSYWQIAAGFSQIWFRQPVSFPAYSYILWLSTKIIGSSEIALRIPSILAMLGAVYLLYRSARKMFHRDVAMITTIVFCLHPIIIFASIDVRPYAFAVLVTNAAIFTLLRLQHNNSVGAAFLFGALAACILYFQFLFAVIFPAFVLCYFIIKMGQPKSRWRQFWVATLTFVLIALPTVPGLCRLFRDRQTHVWDKAPQWPNFIWTLAPGYLPYVAAAAILVAAVVVTFSRQPRTDESIRSWRLPVSASLALLPALILYTVSVATSIHIFAPHYCVITVPGIAIAWGLVANRYLTRSTRLLFCVALVGVSAFVCFRSPSASQHGITWKYALQAARKNSSADNAPIVICSDFIESDYAPMPLKSANDSFFFTPLSYYKLNVPVVPMPQSLNKESVLVGSQFLRKAESNHQRFLAMGNIALSTKTLQWLASNASEKYFVHKLGVFGGVEVLEFLPRAQAGRQQASGPAGL